jgi:hypothetical protein
MPENEVTFEEHEEQAEREEPVVNDERETYEDDDD